MDRSCHAEPWIPEEKLGTATLTIDSTYPGRLFVLEEACAGCAWRDSCHFEEGITRMLVNATVGYNHLSIISDHGHGCSTSFNPWNMGSYHLNVTGNCTVSVIEAPENPVWAFVVLILGISSLFVYDLSVIYRTNNWSGDKSQDRDEYGRGHIPFYRGRNKLASLNAMRGLSLVTMAFVNNGGGGFSLFRHSRWDGLTVADIVFPIFLYVMGFAHQLSMGYRYNNFPTKKFLIRTAAMFCLGLLINGGSDLRELRIMGVLQRLAICQLLAAPLLWIQNITQSDLFIARDGHRRFSRPEAPEDSDEELSSSEDEENTMPVLNPIIGDWKHVSFLHFSIVGLVVFVSSIVYISPSNLCPHAYLGPGGLADNATAWGCTGGIYGWIDRVTFGNRHIFHNPTCREVFDCVDFDPEGILSTFFCLINLGAGAHAAMILRCSRFRSNQRRKLLFYATLYSAVGLLLHFFFVPINKNLWSLSYAILTSGICHGIYCILREICDRRYSYIEVKLLQHAGNNSLLVYVMMELLGDRIPFVLFIGSSHLLSSLMAMWSAMLMVAINMFLRYKGIQVSL